MSEKRREGVEKAFASISGERRRASESVRRDKRSQLSKRFRASESLEGGYEGVTPAAPASLSSLPPLHQVCTRLSFVGTPEGNEAVRILRQYLSGEDAPIKAVLHGGALPHLIANLRVSDETVQQDSLWCMTNMATGDHDDTRHVLQAAPELIQLLASGSPSLSEQACWALGNIAADSDDELKATLLANGVLPPLLVLLASFVSASPAMSPRPEARTVAWTISNLARGSTPAELFTSSGSIPFLLSLTSSADAGLAFEVWWIFTFLTAKSEEAINVMLREGLAVAVASAAANAVAAVASGLIRPHDNAAEIVPILRILGNLTSGPVEWMDLLLQQPQLLPCLISLASSASDSVVVKDVLAIFRNILGGLPTHRAAALHSGILPYLLGALDSRTFGVRREAVLAVRNACAESFAIEALLISGGQAALGHLVEMLGSKDPEVILACLQLIRAMALSSPEAKAAVVERCQNLGISDVLEALQYGAFPEAVRVTANDLIEDVFDEEPEEPAGSSSVLDLGGWGVVEPSLISGMGRGRHLAQPSWM